MFYGKNREINNKLSLSPLCTWSYDGDNNVCQKSLISTQHIFISGLHCDVFLPFLQRQKNYIYYDCHLAFPRQQTLLKLGLVLQERICSVLLS